MMTASASQMNTGLQQVYKRTVLARHINITQNKKSHTLVVIAVMVSFQVQ